MTITHTTTDQAISKMTRNELMLDVLQGQFGDYSIPRSASKTDMVHYVCRHRDRLLKTHEDTKAAENAARLEQLNHEMADGIGQKAIVGLAKGLTSIVEEFQSRISAFQERAAAGRISSAGDYLEGALMADEVIGRYIGPMKDWMVRQSKERTETIAELTEQLQACEKEALAGCVNYDSYRHNSTSMVTNLENIAKHKALQYSCRLFTNVLKCWEKDLDQTNEDKISYCEYVTDRNYRSF